MPARMICELNAPARPRSPVTSRIATLSWLSCSWRIGSELDLRPGRLGGLAGHAPDRAGVRPQASMRCSARRRRAAATISIARVILRMFWTEAMRFLTSR